MISNKQNLLTYVLSNGDEKTIHVNGEKLHEIVRWFHDKNSQNAYEIQEQQTVLFKDTILSVRY
ncbi:MAG: hypothetical protein N2484_12295 [Clostridia bacterium]|nr:hypothetical protein [Clostridia bacterium]